MTLKMYSTYLLYKLCACFARAVRRLCLEPADERCQVAALSLPRDEFGTTHPHVPDYSASPAVSGARRAKYSCKATALLYSVSRAAYNKVTLPWRPASRIGSQAYG